MPPEFTDDQAVIREVEALGADVTYEPWDAGVDWQAFDVVALRSPWDYSLHRDDFLDWAQSVGPALHNSEPLVRWNSDKRYLADLEAAGLAVIETEFVEPGSTWDGDEREVVVKPTVSAGGRHTGRFRPEVHDLARALMAEIHAAGKTAMVQPFQPSVDSTGETALVFIGGELSHSLRKGAVLRPDEVAPMREGGIMAAEAMYQSDLVLPGDYEADELELATGVLAHVGERFGYEPLYARVDMVRDASGAPLLMELEAIEPNLYIEQVPEAAPRLARAILAKAGPYS